MQCEVFRVEIRPQERKAIIPTLSYVSLDGSEILPTEWEASIDGGTSWRSAHDSNGFPMWLVAAPGYPGPGDTSNPAITDFVVTRGRTKMLIRIVDSSVTEISDEIEIVLIP
jgi:hypothetical protein